MEFVSAINIHHKSMREVSHFLCDHFNFSLIAQDSSSVTVNNGVLSVRFVSNKASNDPVNLDLETTDLAEAGLYLKSKGFNALEEIKQTETFRKEQVYQGPHQLVMTLHQVLSEDDLGILPDLNTTLNWDPDAEAMAKSMLTHVTLHFRNSARKKMVEQAEALAVIEGKLEVGQDEMVTAFLYTTPNFKQEALQNLLTENGISQDFIDTQLTHM